MAKKKKNSTLAFPEFVDFENAIPFLEEMADNNNRDWFNENKNRYEDLVRTPALSFIQEMTEGMAKISECFLVVPKKVGGSMMRPYRDTRFSKDKTPLKTNIGIQFRHRMGKDAHAPGFYVHIEPGKSFLGVGAWRPDSATLKLVRQFLDSHHKEWQKAVSKLEKASDWAMGGESLKRNPQGFSLDHPGIELLKLKDHILVQDLTDKQVMDKKFPKLVAKCFKQTAPYVRLLCQAMNVPF